MTTHTESTIGYAIVNPDDAEDHYADTDVPGEFRSLTSALGADQIAAMLIRVPAHSDFEREASPDPKQSTG